MTFSLFRAFIHISTAYTSAITSRTGQEINETFFQATVPPDALIEFVETVDETTLKEITPA